MDLFDRTLRLELRYLRLAWKFGRKLEEARQRGHAADEAFWLEQLSGVFRRRNEALDCLSGSHD